MIKAFWDLLGLVFIIYQGIFSPYRICFNDMAVGGVAIFEIIQDFFFIIDIFISLNTGIYDNGSLVLQRKHITISYFKLWFWIDIVASFPYPLAISYQDYFDINNALSNNKTVDDVLITNI